MSSSNNNNNNNNANYKFYFKLAYTCQTKYYTVNPNSKISEFINDIKTRARVDFNINNDEDVEIVEAGQFDNINGRNAEMAPALQPSEYTLKDLYEHNYKNTAFYIRPFIRHRLNLEHPNIET